ncbi:FUSC family protein [Streptomyces sp. TRM 70361]|uniref:FUSC family protein n=1 Tax=Streptomyces sp. TRM 70361 TaxID=3116553 RepID=UPI002E7C0F14|nr:FUSC family protein [Streptomyces sp. TRM 70361]MEE1939950.1 FUSC family protein [Streptomyces sp. TRM 70361]
MVARTTASPGDRFAAFDPGLTRLTSATRAVLGAAVTLAVLTALGGSGTTLLVGGFTAMATSLAVSDLHPRNQLVTLGLGAPLFLAVLTAGAVLAPYPAAAKAAFLLLIHLAVQARRFGPRGLGLGIFGFMAFFLALFAEVRADRLPHLGAAVLVAFGAVAGVWCCVGPVTASGVLARLGRTFDARLHDVLRDTASVITAGRGADARVRSLERHLDGLHATVLLIEDFLGERPVGEAADDLLRRVSRTEVAAQRLAVRAVRAPADPGGPAERAVRRRLEERILALGHRSVAGAAGSGGQRGEKHADGAADHSAGSAFLRDCFRAVDELAAALRTPVPCAGLRVRGGAPPCRPAPSRARAVGAAPRGAGDAGSPGRGVTRRACQVTAASALAMAGGHLLSPDLWYWAVVAVWAVFVGTESTGEVLLQCVRRLTGTVLGVVFGYGLAALAGGDGPLLLGLLLVCMFGMFFTPPATYWAVTFFLTGMLSMLLALLDTFSADVLLVRVQETALGVFCGVLAAVLVLPTTVRRAGDEELAGFLLTLGRLLRAAAEGGEAGTPADRMRAAHALDRARESFRKACLPLTHPLNPQRGRRRRARHLLELVGACAYHARSLAAAADCPPTGRGAEYVPRLAAAAGHAQETLAHLVRVTRHRPGAAPPAVRPGVTRALSLLSQERRASRHPLSREQRMLLHVRRLDATLTALARVLDPSVPERAGRAAGPSGGAGTPSPRGAVPAPGRGPYGAPGPCARMQSPD